LILVTSSVIICNRYLAPENFIRPGFGMSETCAVCIYSEEILNYDLQTGTEFCFVIIPLRELT
jgi:hypothetical protein